MQTILTSIRRELQQLADPATLESSRRFFKEAIDTYGVKTPVVNKLSKDSFRTIKHLPKAEIFALCNELWQSGKHEEAIIACNWSNALHRQFTPDDFAVFEKWIRQDVTNWATCDTLCNHTVGEFIQRYPDDLSKLKEFTQSDNRWVKRAAAVSLIIPARRGKFLTDILEIADRLLTDPDDLVQKGYGWMLKSASEAHQQEIFNYVVSKKAVMPRTALRYAIEKMPKERKAEAMSRE